MREPAKALGDQRRHMRIHRPGQVFGSGRAELAAGHEHDVRQLRQRLDLGAVQKIGLDAFDAPAGQLLAQAFFAEARHAHDALARRRALGETRQRRPDLAADAQNDEIARNLCEIGDERRRRRGHHVFEMIDVAKAIGQGGGGTWSRRMASASLCNGWPGELSRGYK